MSPSNGFQGVPKCYIFKSRLQEYAQKAGILTPVYETTKEGPSHEPSFRSTVIVNNGRYDSLPGFFNRKAAEQSAAEIALIELAKSGNSKECISSPVHETGLCKNLLQEYAQKMNYAIPSYAYRKVETQGKLYFTSTVEIGGIQYIGAVAKTKREAEIKAARTALLAIQEHARGPGLQTSGSSLYIVVPCKKKDTESNKSQEETAKVLKPRKVRFKKWMKKKFSKKTDEETKLNQTERATDITENGSARKAEDTTIDMFGEDLGVQHMGSKRPQNAESGFQAEDSGMLVVQANQNYQNACCGAAEDSGMLVVQANQNYQNACYGALDPTNGNTETSSLLPVQSTASVQVRDSRLLVADTIGTSQVAEPVNLNFKQSGQETSNLGILPAVQLKDPEAFVTEGNEVSGTGPATSMSSSLSTPPEAPVVMGVNPLAKDNAYGQ
ncbi:hypothetical protein NE237_023002 [Protea cynaroides]|uniref:DRBM domain-containing protein n=1 Tax=Protea cynaroides TaxID=273540 RepID=A0A9Q0K6A5_9MAGN|nr:hypothetical protein NE237_023002 [Protea cynaroides]